MVDVIGSGCGIMAVGAVIPAGQKKSFEGRRSGEASVHGPSARVPGRSQKSSRDARQTKNVGTVLQ
jgi:hypothetical protein